MITNAINTVEATTSYASPEKPQSVPAVNDQEAAITSPETGSGPGKADESVWLTPGTTPELHKELRQKVAEVIPKVRELMQKNQRSLDFEVAEEFNRIIITVIDKETNRVIRQIPPEDFIGIANAYEQGGQEGLGGLLISSRA